MRESFRGIYSFDPEDLALKEYLLNIDEDLGDNLITNTSDDPTTCNFRLHF